MSDIPTRELSASPQTVMPLTDWHRIADDKVATYNSAGFPASLFRDDAWNIEAYGKNAHNRNIHFRGHVPAGAHQDVIVASTRQWKQMMYFLMHEVTDDMPAPTTLKIQMGVLRAFTRYAATRQLTLYQALSNVAVVVEFIAEEGNEISSQRLHAILVHLHRLGARVTGLQVPLRQLHRPMLERFGERAGSSQHPVIPTRVYQHFLATCERELEIVTAISTQLEELLADTYSGKAIHTSDALSSAAAHFNCLMDLRGLSAFVMEVYALCQALILAFTGMRAAEAENLPYDCLRVVWQDGVEHYSIEGVTTKLTGGRVKRVSWVTSHLAAKAVKLAQRLSGAVHRAHGGDAYKGSSDGSFLLFSRVGLFSGDYAADRGPAALADYIANLRQRTCLEITQEDITELKRIDPHRAWESEPAFAVGARWPFTRHQLRRSLALYAHRSGLVTLPSLKRQLHHITMEMSMYYARGSAFAKGFIDADKDHFAIEWADSEALSRYMAYAEQVLFTDERLFGGHAAWVNSKAVQQSAVSVFSRTQTVAMFKKGELAYHETVLGGCASIEPCKSSPLNWLPIECLESNCKNLIVVPSKLQRVIKSQERQVAKLKEISLDSVEYRMEKQTLDNLLAAQQRGNNPEKQ